MNASHAPAPDPTRFFDITDKSGLINFVLNCGRGPMQSRFLKRTAIISLITVFTVSFVSYSILSYIPPAIVQHELAYSIEHCPTHNAEPTVHILTEFFQDSGKEGHEKHCVCYSCDLKRPHFDKTERFSSPVREELVIYQQRQKETPHVKDITTKISSRAPPFSSAVS